MPDYDVFTYLTTPGGDLYRSVMRAFLFAKQRFTVHLRPEDVHELLVGDTDLMGVTDALNRLAEWGNLRADPDTSRVTSVEDFRRARFLYQLTGPGEAGEHALRSYDENIGRRGALQAVALTDIASQLRALTELVRGPEPDPAKVYLALRGLVGRFTDLADNAQAFMGSLQRTIDLHDTDVETFRAYKDQLIAYLERFIRDLIGTGADIAGLIEAIPASTVDSLLKLAAHRDAEDTAPGEADGQQTRAIAYVRALAVWRERWAGFRAWFISSTHHPSQAKLLRSRARAAIPQLLAVVAALNDRRSGRSDRSTDFRTLARWFAEAPSTDDAHRLWRIAFGMSSSRHLTLDEQTLADRAAHPVPAATPWAEAPPLRISPRLRRTGSYERRGRPNQVIDRSAHRRHLADQAARQHAETSAARAALCTGGPVLLSEFAELDALQFRLFLALLGDALAARTPGAASVQTVTTDGSLLVRLTRVPGRAGVRTGHGVLFGPEHLVEIEDLSPGAD